MDYRKESDLKSICCDSQSNKRLSSYRAQLSSDCDGIAFDDRILEVVENYIRKPEMVSSVRAYLNNLTDDSGVAFSRSHKSYDTLLGILEGFTKEEAKPFTWNRNFRRAAEIVGSRYSKANLKPLIYHNDNEVLEAFSDSSTSAGFTFITDGFRHKCDFPEERLLATHQERCREAILHGSFNTYTMLFTRTQCSGEYDDDGNETHTCKHKTRPVWAVDMHLVATEQKWAKPMNGFLSTYRYSAIGKSDNAIGRTTCNRRASSNRWLSLDYSRYDASIPSWLIHEAFKVVKKAFPGMDEYHQRLLQVIEEDFIHKNAILSDSVLHVDHGNPSGSGFTAIINGICNELITETWRAAFSIDWLEYMIMGDDNLIFFRDIETDFDSICSYIKYNFGIETNAGKDSFGSKADNPKFLSRIWRFDGPYRHPKQLLSRMLFPERFRKYDQIKELTPELVFYSYYLAYSAGMQEAFDMPRFLREHANLTEVSVYSSKEVNKQMPWIVRQQRLQHSIAC